MAERREETDERRPLEKMKRRDWMKGTEEEEKGRQGWELKEGRQVGGSQGRSRTGKKWNTTAFSHPYGVKKKKKENKKQF